MPHFFFNVHGDQVRIDGRGLDLPDIEMARSEAVELLANLLTVNPGLLPFAASWCIDVADDRGLSLFRIDVAASAAPTTAETETKLIH